MCQGSEVAEPVAPTTSTPTRVLLISLIRRIFRFTSTILRQPRRSTWAVHYFAMWWWMLIWEIVCTSLSTWFYFIALPTVSTYINVCTLQPFFRFHNTYDCAGLAATEPSASFHLISCLAVIHGWHNAGNAVDHSISGKAIIIWHLFYKYLWFWSWLHNQRKISALIIHKDGSLLVHRVSHKLGQQAVVGWNTWQRRNLAIMHQYQRIRSLRPPPYVIICQRRQLYAGSMEGKALFTAYDADLFH
jgi:hypothetical protein